MRTEFLSSENVIGIYRKVAGDGSGEPRQDIEEMLSFYSWTGPVLERANRLGGVITYAGPGEDYQRLLNHRGKQRLAADVALNYLFQRFQVGDEPRGRIERMIVLMAQSSVTSPPLFLLAQPYEVFNGQTVDGYHKLLAYLVSVMLTGRDQGVPVYWGYDTNPRRTAIRALKSHMKKSLYELKSV